jgi:fucose 4-O-acetylase-like acetyltransferase
MRVAASARDTAVDALRGVAIVLVVLGHINRGLLEGRAGAWAHALRVLDFLLYAIHMPVFFYLAGYFTWMSLSRRSPGEYVASRWANVIYPYLFWSLITVMAHQAGTLVTPIHHEVRLQQLAEVAWAPINVLWFLYALLVLQLVATGAHRHPVALTIAAFGASAVASFWPTSGLAILNQTALHAPFFAVGVLLAARGENAIPSVIRRMTVVAAAVAIFVGGCVYALTSGLRDPATFEMLPISLCGVAALSGLTATVTRGRIWRHLVALGERSLPIYLLHSFVLALVPRLLALTNYNTVPAELFVGTAVGVYGSWAIYAVICRCKLAGVTGLSPVGVPRLRYAS